MIVKTDLQRLAEKLDGCGSCIPEGRGVEAWLQLLKELHWSIEKEDIIADVEAEKKEYLDNLYGEPVLDDERVR